MFSNDFIGAKVSAGMKRGAQPGNLNALKPGFYSKHFQKAELKDLGFTQVLQEVIAIMQLMTWRWRALVMIWELINLLVALGLDKVIENVTRG